MFLSCEFQGELCACSDIFVGETIHKYNKCGFEKVNFEHMQQMLKYYKKIRSNTQYKNRHFGNKKELEDSFSLQTKSLNMFPS